MIYTLFAAWLIGGTSEEELKKKVKEEQERVAGFWNIAGTVSFHAFGGHHWDMLHRHGQFISYDIIHPASQKRIESMKTKLVHVDLNDCIEIGLKGLQVYDVHSYFTGSDNGDNALVTPTTWLIKVGFLYPHLEHLKPIYALQLISTLPPVRVSSWGE